MAHADRQSRQTSSRHESWKSTASLATTASTNGGETDIDEEEDDNDNLSLTESLAKKAKNFWTTPSPTHILIVSLLGALAGGLALPVEIPVIRQFACEWYFNKHPEASAFFVLESEDRCQSPVIAKLAGEIIASARILNALITVLCLTVYSDMLSRFGRKPMFTFVAFCLTCSIVLFGAGASIGGPVGIALIAANFVFSGLGSQPLLQLTFQSYIVDCVKSEERSPTFAMLGSATFAGLSISAVASSLMTRYSSIPLLPFWVGSGVFACMFLYSAFVLPEALTPERQKELMQANEATQESHRHHNPSGEDSDSEDSEDGALETIQKRMNFVRKLQILLPKRDEATGKKDYRLLVLAIAFTIYRIGGLYTNDLLLLTTTGSFGFSGAENGILVGFITASKAILLMGILPIVIRKGRSKYTRWVEQKSSVHPDMDGHSESSRLLAQRDRAYGTNGKKLRKSQKEEVAPAGAERFDLYFGAVSFSIDALALIGVGCSRAVWQLYASTALLAISAAGGPSVQSIATQIASKALTDQVLSAMALIDNAGAVLSPLVLGGIYSATARTMPSLAWFVSAALFLLAAAILLCMPARKGYVKHKSRSSRKRRAAERS